MTPASRSGGRDDPAATQPAASTTPNSDLQAEDAGTTESSGGPEDDSATAANRAMKQTSKTAAESGDEKR